MAFPKYFRFMGGIGIASFSVITITSMGQPTEQTPPLASSVMVAISFGVTAPSSAAIPSQVADLTKRFGKVIWLMLLLSNKFFILTFPFMFYLRVCFPFNVRDTEHSTKFSDPLQYSCHPHGF